MPTYVTVFLVGAGLFHAKEQKDRDRYDATNSRIYLVWRTRLKMLKILGLVTGYSKRKTLICV